MSRSPATQSKPISEPLGRTIVRFWSRQFSERPPFIAFLVTSTSVVAIYAGYLMFKGCCKQQLSGEDELYGSVRTRFIATRESSACAPIRRTQTEDRPAVFVVPSKTQTSPQPTRRKQSKRVSPAVIADARLRKFAPPSP